MGSEEPALLKAFPLGFTLDQRQIVVTAGRTLQRLVPSLIGSTSEDVIQIVRPIQCDGKLDMEMLVGRLCIVALVNTDIELRGEFIAHGQQGEVSFVGTLNIQSSKDLSRLGVRRQDLAHHDVILDLVAISNTHAQHSADLEELNTRLLEEIELKKKYQTAERSASRQLKLVADLRLIVCNMKVVEFQANETAAGLIESDQAFDPDEKVVADANIEQLIPVLGSIDGLVEYLASDSETFSFDFDSHFERRKYVFEGECQRLDDGSVLILVRDITRQRELHQNLEFRANYDQLTGLANREVLFRELSAIYKSRDLRSIEESYLLIIDLDDFKSVNDVLGHAAGDRLLQLAANRIKESVRNNDLVTRLGGDEFAVVLRGVRSDTQELDPLLIRLEQYMSREVDLRGFAWSPRSSMGVAPLTSADSASEILKNADLTMYDAKRAGKGTVHHYSSSIRDNVVEDMKIQHGLKLAIEYDKIHPVFQPVFSLTTNRIVAVEALARWHDKELGSVSPERFVALAEKSNVIFSLTEHMLKKSADAMKSLRREGLISESTLMHVNISPSVFRIGSFQDMLRRVLNSAKLDPRCLVLEMTESVIVHDEQSVRDQLNQLSELGIKLAIDDFGKGYSSLGYLEAYPFDILKIDRQFVSHLDERSVPKRLSAAIIGLAKALDLAVIAEGIEKEGELQALRELGCQMGQGYYLAKPMRLDDLQSLLADHRVVA